jgi:signal transduction histidine kinase
VLAHICERARTLVGADSAVILLRGGDDRLTAAATAGDPAWEEAVDPRLAEEAFRTGSTVSTDAVVLAPMAADDIVLGALAVIASEVGPFDSVNVATVETFATETAIAMVLADGRADRARLGILEDRERIAADMHDRVIQRLFATGMGLQATAARSGDEMVAQRIDASVRELDETITELRSAIFRLSERPQAEPFNERIRAVVGRFGPQLGFDPVPGCPATSTRCRARCPSSSSRPWRRRCRTSPGTPVPRR